MKVTQRVEKGVDRSHLQNLLSLDLHSLLFLDLHSPLSFDLHSPLSFDLHSSVRNKGMASVQGQSRHNPQRRHLSSQTLAVMKVTQGLDRGVERQHLHSLLSLTRLKAVVTPNHHQQI
jgi:hypothetical protein